MTYEHDEQVCGICRHRAAIARDEARIQAELRDRLDRCDPFAYEAALREAAHLNPDLITEALDATGAPT